MRRSTRICRKPPPNRPNHPSFSLKIGSFVTPSGRAALGVGKSTLREERARRALLFSKTGGLLPIEVLESVLQGCFGCDDHASRFRHQLRIRIQRSDSETRKLRCLLACEYLVTPRDPPALSFLLTRQSPESCLSRQVPRRFETSPPTEEATVCRPGCCARRPTTVRKTAPSFTSP